MTRISISATTLRRLAKDDKKKTKPAPAHKLVAISGESRSDPKKADADFALMRQQEGCLGGGVEEHRLMYTEAKQKGYDRVYYATIFMVWPMSAQIPVGCSVASRKTAKRFGVKVPRGVDA